MATETILVNVVDKSIPIENHKNIAIIGMPNPASNVEINREQALRLIQFPQYWITDAVTGVVISGANIYDYFTDPSGGGVDPEEVQEIVRSMTDAEASTTSTNPVSNSAITNYVNNAIESSTAEFKGTYETKAEMDAITADNNDYAFLIIYNYTLLTEEPDPFDPTQYYKLVNDEYVPGESGDTWATGTWYEQDDTVNHYERYKWVDPPIDNSHWAYEYDVSNTSFTSEQWAAINSGINAERVAKIENAIPGLPSGTTENHLVGFGNDGYTVKDSGIAFGPNYITVNGVRQYSSLTEPTGDIPVGSIGFGF